MSKKGITNETIKEEHENPHFLENWLRLKVQQEQKEFNDLTREEAKKNVRSLTFVQLDLKGKVVIENFPDLTQLNLSNNELEEVIIRNCPDLKLVSLAHNQLTKLKIENCPSVKELYTSFNQLTNWDVPVEDLKNKNLRVISYSENPLTEAEKARLDALGLKDTALKSRVDGPAQEWLDAKYPLDIRDSVEKLDISELGLQGNLDLKGFTNLKSLDCSGNELTSINYLSDCGKLEYLDCSCNLLRNINLIKNLQLQELYAHNNQLTKMIFTKNFVDLKNLVIGQNKLVKLDVSKLVNLRKLDCSLNKKLKKLDLSNNLDLKTLLCYENNLSSLEVKHLKSLKYLYCYKNILDSLDVSGLTQLRQLYCAGNARRMDEDWIDHGLAQSFNVQGCANLEEIDCAENALSELNFSSLPKLNFISAKENMIENFNASNCPELTYLDISKKHLYFDSIPIKKINLTGSNNLKEIYFDTPLSDKEFFGEQATINWQTMPNLERVEHGKHVLVEEEEKKTWRYFTKTINVLAQRNTSRIIKILANPDNYQLADLLKLIWDKKNSEGVPQELREKLSELITKKCNEETRKRLLGEDHDKDPEDSGEEENPDSTPPTEEPSKVPTPQEQEEPTPQDNDNNEDKDQLIKDLKEKIAKLQEENESLKSGSKTPDNQKKVEEVKKEIEKTREKITKSNLDENKKKELLKLLEELLSNQNKTTDNSVESPSSSHNYNLVWIPVLIGQAALLSALIYAYWSSWKKPVKKGKT